MLIDHFFVFFGKMSLQALCLFFNLIVRFLLLSFLSSLRMLDIFSHSVGCLSILIVPFAVQKLIVLI